MANSPPTELLPVGMRGLHASSFLKSVAHHEIRLTDRQRVALMQIATRIVLPARSVVYHQDSPGGSVYAITSGAVKGFRDLRRGKHAVTAFLFARDLFGLAEYGQYVNTTHTLSLTTMYRLPVMDLAHLLKHDAELQFKFLVKITHELRESQRRMVLMHRRDATGRLAMFISMMSQRLGSETAHAEIWLPMTRADIAGYIGLSTESVSRAATALERRGLVVFDTPHEVRIVDPSAFSRLVAAV